MWIFRGKGKHIKLETLSEYLDERLSAPDRGRLEQHLEACPRCQEELGSLQYTVGLLRRAPEVGLRRSFTLERAPVIGPVASPARWGPRVPAFAYGAAASVAVILFVVVLSADLSGFLSEDASAPQQQVHSVELPGVSTPSPQPTPVPDEPEKMGVAMAPQPPEAEQAVAAAAPSDAGMAKAAPAPTPPARSAVSPQGASESGESEDLAQSAPLPPAQSADDQAVTSSRVAPSQQTALASSGADTMAVAGPEATAAPQVAPFSAGADTTAVAPSSEATPPPQAASVSAEAETIVVPPPPEAMPEPSESEGEFAIEGTVMPLPTQPPLLSPQPAEIERAAAPVDTAEASEAPRVQPPKAPTEGTATIWRALEGASGGFALILVAVVFWKMRQVRRRTAL